MKVVRRRDKRGLFVLLGIFVMIFLFTFLSRSFDKLNEEAEAASLANFDPGYIISDYQMGNYNSMSEAEIQAFLSAKGNCRDTRTYLASYYPNLSYHIKDGHFVCLAEEVFGEGVLYGDDAPNGETAAHVIWQAAQDYRINPQVLIVLLQKEQGLITDSWPNNRQYRSATGYGCPDTAPCNVEYYGFKNQVRKAAAMFRTVLNGGWTNYPLGENYVQYNPDASCGGSVVNIRSLATSALYRYTPYQPNAGALAAGYGTAACGAYGNRNFYLYFEDWFSGITNEAEGQKIDNVRGMDGRYQIKSFLNDKKMLSAKNDGVVIWEENSQLSQNWYLFYDEKTDAYSITNVLAGGVLTAIKDENTSVGARVQIQDADDSCAQKWKIGRLEEAGYLISSSCLNVVLDVAGANTSNGTLIQGWESNETSAQKWILEKVVEENVAQGDYVVRSAVNNNETVDIAGGANNSRNGTNIQLWEENGTEAQVWNFSYHGDDGTYTIVNPTTGRVLDVAGGSKNAGANIQLWENNGSCAQRWYVEKEGEHYVFISACSGLLLGIDGTAALNGVNIQLSGLPKNSNVQKWMLSVEGDKVDEEAAQESLPSGENTLTDENGIVEGGVYIIRSLVGNDKTIDIAGGAENAKNGTNIQTWENNGTKAQEWKITKNSDDGTYIIVNPTTGRVLDVAGGSKNAGANIQLWENNGSCAQRWKISKQSEGYILKSACSDLALDVAGASSTNGANIQLWVANGTDAQKWSFNLVE